MPGQSSTADWAALVPWKGIQNVPLQIAGIIAASPTPGTVTLPLAKLTPTGTNGSITLTNGVYVSSVAPT